MFRVLLFLVITIQVAIAGPQEDAYQQGLKFANDNMQAPLEKINTFEQKVVQEAGIEKYTDNPEQTKYYRGVTAGSSKDLLEDGNKGYRYSEDDKENSAPQAALKSFRKNPKVKIDPNNPHDPIMARAKHIMQEAVKNAETSDKKDVPATQKTKLCKVEYTKKICDEQKGLLQRVCYKLPTISVYEKQVEHTGCKNIEVRQGAGSSCSYGYSGPGTLFYTDMLEGPTYDDIFLCSRSSHTDECNVGYLVQGRSHHNNFNGNSGYVQGYGVVPKKTQGYMRFMHTYHGALSGKIFNETKKEVVISGNFTGGQVIKLPRSDTEDQGFRFYPSNGGQVGVVIIYVDRINKIKEPKIEWSETCQDA